MCRCPHAFDLLRSGRVEIEGRPELARARMYGARQVLLLVPGLVAIIAIAQRSKRRR
jgi:hypothetical protein